MPAATPAGLTSFPMARSCCAGWYRMPQDQPRGRGTAPGNRFGKPGNAPGNTVRNGGGNTRKAVGFADANFKVACFRLHLAHLAASVFAPVAGPTRVRSEARGCTCPVRLTAASECARVGGCAAARMHLGGGPWSSGPVSGYTSGRAVTRCEVARAPLLACTIGVSAAWDGGCIPSPYRVAVRYPSRASHGRQVAASYPQSRAAGYTALRLPGCTWYPSAARERTALGRTSALPAPALAGGIRD